MNEPAVVSYANFILPPSVISRVDVSRLVAELERVDAELTAIRVRAGAGVEGQENPTLSSQLSEFLAQNKLTLKTSKERSELVEQMHLLKDKVPTVHMTFATSTDAESLGLLASWLRSSIHPQTVISVGLQPALVAGVYLRTPNHVHDLSLRAAIKSARAALRKEMEQVRGNV